MMALVNARLSAVFTCIAGLLLLVSIDFTNSSKKAVQQSKWLVVGSAVFWILSGVAAYNS